MHCKNHNARYLTLRAVARASKKVQCLKCNAQIITLPYICAQSRASKKVQRLKCNAQIITLPYIARSCASKQKSAMPKVQCTNNHGVAPAPHAHTQYFFVTTIVEDSSQIHPHTIHNSNTPLTQTIQKHTHKHNTNTTHTQKHTYTQTPPPPPCVPIVSLHIITSHYALIANQRTNPHTPPSNKR